MRRAVARRLTVCAASTVALITAGCAGPATTINAAPAAAFRTPGAPAPWQTVAPEKVGLDGAKLNEIAAKAGAANSNCLLVIRHGKIAGEWYFNGTTQESTQNVWSVTKSVTSTLVGIAQDERKLRIRDSASKWIPEWKGTPAEAVTVKNLLSNDSGRQWSTAIDYDQLIRAADRTAFGIGLEQTTAPKKTWAYNNAAIQTLEQVLERSTGTPVDEYAKKKLFEPLGMTNSTITKDVAGNPQTFQGLDTNCRDLGRFGMMALRHGRVGTKQVVSRGWLGEATGRPSTQMNSAYGYLWWLNRYGVVGSPLAETTLEQAKDPETPRGRLVKDANPSTFWAIGLGNQIVQVDRVTDTVVVRLGATSLTTQDDFGAAATAQVLKTVKRPGK